jgi:hypothetical protein
MPWSKIKPERGVVVDWAVWVRERNKDSTNPRIRVAVE